MEATPSAKPVHPFQNIGLALSGGGFRAASFSLGVMHYLHSVPSGLLGKQGNNTSLLERVKFITSTSGGSITNAFYTSQLYKGGEIPVILRRLFATLQGDQMLEHALDRLTDESAWTKYPDKERNLINAFSLTYNEELLGGETFGVYFDRKHNPHIEEVCINATELNNGLYFRFQTNGNPGTLNEFGNFYLHFRQDGLDALKSIRIADAVAASSCFPSGFEPIVFPNDFANATFGKEALKKAFEIAHNNEQEEAEVARRPFGLMDGGVVDNQGLGSLMQEDRFRREGAHGHEAEEAFSTLMVADVASYFMDPYEIPEEKSGFLLDGRLKWVVRLLMLLVPAPLVGIGFFIGQGAPWYYSLFLITALLLSVGIVWIFLAYGGFVKKQSSNAIGIMLRKFKRKFLNMRLGRIGSMGTARVRSVSMLAQELFLKQVRRMYFDHAYGSPDVKPKMVSLFIYDLSTVHAKRCRRRLAEKYPDSEWWPRYQDLLIPTPALAACADEARSMDTTLWYDPGQQDKMDSVVATGQFTTCYNLIKYINRMEVLNGSVGDDLKEMRTRLLADWKKFQQNPHWKVDELKGK
jgi:predicted acylesterase/phospholipase RssA